MCKCLNICVPWQQTCEDETEITAKIAAGNKRYHALDSTLKKTNVKHSLRVSLYKAKIRPIVTCGTESWTLKNKMETVLMTWAKKILIKVQGLINEKVSWRIKINEEICNKCKSPDILIVIKACIREWFRHVRLDGGGIIKELLQGKRGSGREKNGLRLRWMNDVQQGLRNTDVTRW